MLTALFFLLFELTDSCKFIWTRALSLDTYDVYLPICFSASERHPH